MTLNDKKIFVTGASGFIGSNLVKKLSDLGADVTVLINNTDEINTPVHKVYYDGTIASLLNPLEEAKIDVIVHLATYFTSKHITDDIAKLVDSNIKLGTFLLEVSQVLEIPYFINTSTYAQTIDDSAYNPQNLYAASKGALEAIQKYYEEVTSTVFVTLELTDTYGPYDTRPKFINLVLNAINSGNTFNMSEGKQEISYLYIYDCVNAYVTAIERLLSGKITVNSKFSVYADEIVNLLELVDLVTSILDVKLETNPGFYPYRNREIMKFRPSYERLEGWKPKHLYKNTIPVLMESLNENN